MDISATHPIGYPRPAQASFWLRARIRLIRFVGLAIRFLFTRRHPNAQRITTSGTSVPPLDCLVFRPPRNAPAEHADKLYIDFHGGGFVGGVPGEDTEFCAYMAANVGCVVVSGQYRFAPEHPFPVGLQDCHAVVQWAVRYFGAQKVALGGFSAGGTLSLGVAQIMARERKVLPVALAAFYPVMDFSARSKSEIKEKNPWKRDLFHESYLLKAKESDLVDPLLSPYYATAKEIPGTTLIVIPEFDPNKQDMLDFVERMQREQPSGIAGMFLPKCFHGWNLLPDWIIGKERKERKWEAYARVATEVKKAFEGQ